MMVFGVDKFTEQPYIGMYIINPTDSSPYFSHSYGAWKGGFVLGLVHKYPTIFENSTTHILSDQVKHP